MGEENLPPNEKIRFRFLRYETSPGSVLLDQGNEYIS